MQPLAAALPDTPCLDGVRIWLNQPYVVELLAVVASGREQLTHDTLTGWPRQIAAPRYLRHQLIACGVLPPVAG